MIYSMRLGFIITAASSARAMKPRSARFSPRRRMLSAAEEIRDARAKLQEATASEKNRIAEEIRTAEAKLEKLESALLEEEVSDVWEKNKIAHTELQEEIKIAHAKQYVPEDLLKIALDHLSRKQSDIKIHEWVTALAGDSEISNTTVLKSLRDYSQYSDKKNKLAKKLANKLSEFLKARDNIPCRDRSIDGYKFLNRQKKDMRCKMDNNVKARKLAVGEIMLDSVFMNDEELKEHIKSWIVILHIDGPELDLKKLKARYVQEAWMAEFEEELKIYTDFCVHKNADQKVFKCIQEIRKENNRKTD